MTSSQKFGLGVFMCLSVAMMAASLTRLALLFVVLNSLTTTRYYPYTTYIMLVLYLEAAIAVIMSTVLISRRFFFKMGGDNAVLPSRDSIKRARRYLSSFLRSSSRREATGRADEDAKRNIQRIQNSYPHVTGFTFRTIRSSASSSESPASEGFTGRSESQSGDWDLEADYHRVIREQVH